MEFTVTEETPHRVLYLLPLQDDSGSVQNTYTIKTRYLSAPIRWKRTARKTR